jgi:hypothetical protein
MTRLLLSLLISTAIADADFDPVHWQFRRSIHIGIPSPVASFVVDRTLYQGSRAELADLRIVRDQSETPYVVRGTEALDDYVIAPTTSEEASTHTTFLTIDIGFQGLPHNRVQLVVDPGQFYRSVMVESGRDSTKWRPIAARDLFRTTDREAMTISFIEQWDRYLRIRILNRDNPPLAVRQVILNAQRRAVEFPAEATGQYWLYYGSSGAHRPSYDFAQTRPNHVQPVMVELRGEEINPAYREPQKPWTERHPQVLYAVLAAAILVIGFAAVRLLMHAARKS